MRIAIYGAGGVGAYIGGRLQAGGHDVTFIARGANLSALRFSGLSIRSVQGDLVLPRVAATDDPATVAPVDLVVLGVKLYDLEHAARTLQPLLAAGGMVLPVQNGVDAADRLAAVLGHEAVMMGAAYIVSTLAAPGHVDHRSPFCKLVIAEWGGEASQRATDLAQVLNASGIQASISSGIQVDLWRKFIILAPFAAVACLTRSALGPVLSNPDSRTLLSDAMAEVAAVAKARNIGLPDDIVTTTLQAMDTFPPASKPSMLVDLEAGRPLELASLSGAVVRFGRSAGIATPVHDTALRALALHAKGARP